MEYSIRESISSGTEKHFSVEFLAQSLSDYGVNEVFITLILYNTRFFYKLSLILVNGIFLCIFLLILNEL